MIIYKDVLNGKITSFVFLGGFKNVILTGFTKWICYFYLYFCSVLFQIEQFERFIDRQDFSVDISFVDHSR